MSSLWKFITDMPGLSGEVILFVLIASLIAFIAYGADKAKAIKGKYRIPEITLIALALLGGALGAFLGMCVFRHKTKHLKFTLTVPLLSVVWIIIIAKSFFI